MQYMINGGLSVNIVKYIPVYNMYISVYIAMQFFNECLIIGGNLCGNSGSVTSNHTTHKTMPNEKQVLNWKRSKCKNREKNTLFEGVPWFWLKV